LLGVYACFALGLALGSMAVPPVADEERQDRPAPGSAAAERSKREIRR
jgi:hypothetical protein